MQPTCVHALTYTLCTPYEHGRTLWTGPGEPLVIISMKTCICTRQPSSPVPSHTWTLVSPTPHPKASLNVLLSPCSGPREGVGEGGTEPPPTPVFQRLLPILWSLLLVLQVSVYLLVLRPAAHSHILHTAGLPHPCCIPSACTRGHTRTHLLTLPFLCAYMQVQCCLERLFHHLASLLGEDTQYLPSSAHPWCAHPIADKDGNGGASLWAPA